MDFFSNLSRSQTALFTVLAIGLLGFGGLYFYQAIRDKTVDKPQPWDENNGIVMEDLIQQLRKRIKDNETESKALASYQIELRGSEQSLASATLDLDTALSLMMIQPNYIVKYYRAYNVVRELGKSDPGATAISTPFTDNVQSKGTDYALRYLALMNRLGYEVSFFISPENLLNTSIGVSSINSVSKRISQLSGYGYPAYNGSPANTIPPQPRVERPQKPVADTSGRKLGVAFEQGKRQLQDIVASIDTMTSTRISLLKAENLELKRNLDDAKKKYQDNNLNINKYAVIVGIPLFILAALFMYFYGIRASNTLRADLMNSANFNSQDYQSGLSFTLFSITVLLLILTLLILGLSNVIKDNALSALLGTIAGYVLNTATNKAPSSGTPPLPAGAAHPANQQPRGQAPVSGEPQGERS